VVNDLLEVLFYGKLSKMDERNNRMVVIHGPLLAAISWSDGRPKQK